MRAAHEHTDLTEADFNAIAENLQATLTELKVDKEYIVQIMGAVGGMKNDVLNKKKAKPAGDKAKKKGKKAKKAKKPVSEWIFQAHICRHAASAGSATMRTRD